MESRRRRTHRSGAAEPQWSVPGPWASCKSLWRSVAVVLARFWRPDQTIVLRRLETQKDLQIAADLGLTRDGVRYHVRHLFTKLGVRRRKIVVERARSLGIV